MSGRPTGARGRVRTPRTFHDTPLATPGELRAALAFTARAYWRAMPATHLGLLLVALGSAVLTGLLPLASSRLVADLGARHSPWPAAAAIAVCLGVPALLAVVSALWDSRRQRWAERQTDLELIRLGRGMPDLGILGHGSNNEVLHRVLRAVYGPTQAWVAFSGVLGQVVTVAVVVASVARLGWYIPLLFLLAVVPHTIAARRSQFTLFRTQMAREQEGQRANYAFSTAAVPMLAREVRVFGLADHWQDEHRRLVANVSTALRRARNHQLGVTLGFSAAYVVLVAGVLLVGGRQGHHTAADLTLLVQSMLQLAALAGGTASAWANLLNCVNQTAEYLRLGELMVPHIALAEPGEPVAERWQSGLVLRDVSFSYGTPDDPPVLDHLDLQVPAGEVVALVGENGEGKSTLVRLLTRMDDPTSGTIELDGRPLADYDLRSYRDGVSAVFQDHAHLALSVLDSVALGDPRHADPSATAQVRADVEKALDAGGASSIVAGLPDGLDTLLGAGHGNELSGGGWQRMATARAFHPDAAFVIFDEATSALDVDAERRLFDNFAELVRGRTALVISHRFSTVRNADRIAVLSGGRISEFGTHDELMALDGTYAELFSLQADRYR